MLVRWVLQARRVILVFTNYAKAHIVRNNKGTVMKSIADDSLYDVLEVSPNASAVVIRAAYRCLVQQCHPDKNSGDSAGEARLYLINQAYAVLADPRQRAQYDEKTGLRGTDRRGSGRGFNPAKSEADDGSVNLRPFAFRPIE